MERFLLSTFKDTLAQFIVGFHPEQVNANLLVGKGEIINVDLNVDTINSLILSKLTSRIRLKSAQITKLSFNVTSFTNLKKAPIIVKIDEINIMLVEPMEYDVHLQKGLSTTSSTTTKSTPKRRHYGLVEKISDNITVLINKVNINFQPMGKFKTERKGMWTPPMLSCQLQNLRFELTDEYGEPGSPEVVWRSNHVRRGEGNIRTWMVYKRCTMDLTIGLNTSTEPNKMTHPIIHECHVDVHMAIKRRVNDAGLIGVQIDISIADVDIELKCDDIPIISHAVAGLQYCVTKDRAFEDPLKHDDAEDTKTQTDVHIEITQNNEVSNSNEFTKDSVSIMDNNLLGDESSSDEFDEDDEYAQSSDNLEEASKVSNSAGSNDVISNTSSAISKQTPKKRRQLRPGLLLKQSAKGPLLTIYGSIIILENLTLSLSVHHCNIRALYGENEDGYFDVVAGGLVTELMLLKENKSNKGYFQLSLSYLTVHERYNNVAYPVLLAGFHEVQNMNYVDPNENKPVFVQAVSCEESFPTFHDRSIRDDPIKLRDSFSVQAIGLKTSMNLDKDASDHFFVHELGINNIQLIIDSDPIYRAVCHLWKKDSRYNPRWHTGNWTDVLSPEILKMKPHLFKWEEYVQPLHSSESMIDFFSNATIAGKNICAKIPAGIKEDLHNSDIIVSLGEIMVIVNTHLPRDILDGKITGYTGVKQQKENITYPNDPSDLCYDKLLEDPESIDASIHINPRIQVTFPSFSVELKPILPFLKASQPKKLLSLNHPVILFSMDHFENDTENVLFVSTLIRSLIINVDIELLLTAIGTMEYHFGVINETISIISSWNPEYSEVLIEKTQIQSAQEPQVIFCAHINKAEILFWRQSVPLKQHFEIDIDEETTACVVLLCKLTIEQLELGLESRTNYCNSLADALDLLNPANVTSPKTFCLLKCFIASVILEICNSNSFGKSYSTEIDHVTNQIETEPVKNVPLIMTDLIQFVSLGESISDRYLSSIIKEEEITKASDKKSSSTGLSMRVEIWSFDSSGIAISSEVDRLKLHLDLNAVNNVCTLFTEGLLKSALYCSPQHHSTLSIEEGNSSLFPRGSVGAEIESLISKSLRVEDNPSKLSNTDIAELNDEKVNYFLTKLSASNLIVEIPGHKRMQSGAKHDPSFFALIVNAVNLSLVSFPSTSQNDLCVLESNHPWQKELCNTSKGLHIVMNSHQCLNFISTLNNDESKHESIAAVVSIFGIEVSVHPTDVKAGLQNSSITCSNTNLIERFLNTLSSYKDSLESISNDFKTIFGSISYKSITGASSQNPSHTEKTIDSIQNARLLLNKIGHLIATNDLAIQSALSKKERELDRVRTEMFTKERQRIAVLSILSHTCSGWMRVGDRGTHGQRVVSTTTLTKYWVTLRHSLIILFMAPGMLNPKEIISTDGAELRSMTAGRTNIDASRGFVLIERSGRERVFVAPNEKEYHAWAVALSKTIGEYKSASYKVSEANVENDTTKSDSGHNGTPDDEFNGYPKEDLSNILTSHSTEVQPISLDKTTEADCTEINDKMAVQNTVYDELVEKNTQGNEVSDTFQTPISTSTKEDGRISKYQQTKEKFSSMKSISNRKLGKFGASLRGTGSKSEEPSASEEVPSQETYKTNFAEGNSNIALDSDEEFDTVSLQSSQNDTGENTVDDNKIEKTGTQSRREKMREKMSSINVNAKLSKLGSAVKSSKLQTSNRPTFSNSKIFSKNNSSKAPESNERTDDSRENDGLSNQMQNDNLDTEGSNSVMEFDIIDLDTKNQEVLHSSMVEVEVNNPVNDDSLENKDTDESAPNRRELLRRKLNMSNRLSRIGSAVKSVRPNADALKHLNSDSFQRPGGDETETKERQDSDPSFTTPDNTLEPKTQTTHVINSHDDLDIEGSNSVMEFDIIDLDTKNQEVLHSSMVEVEVNNHVNDDSLENKDTDESAPNRRELLRRKLNMNNRLSRIGSAVKSVRPNADTLKHLNSDSFRRSERRGSGLKLSIGNSSNPSLRDLGDEKVKIKDIKVSNVSLIAPNDNIENENDVLEQIPGKWHVSVESIPNEMAEFNSTIEEIKSVRSDKNEEINDLPQAPSHADLSLDSVQQSETSELLKSLIQRNNEKFLFEIRIVRIDTQNFRSTKVVKKSLPDIAALHTSISEDVARVSMVQSGRQRNNKSQNFHSLSTRDTTPQTLSSELGLLPLDQIRFTGRLLQGLLDIVHQHTNDTAVNSYSVEILAEFLNSCLECQLPSRSLEAIVEFLAIKDLIDDSISRDMISTYSQLKDASGESICESNPIRDATISLVDKDSRSAQIHSLSSACESELIRAKNIQLKLKGFKSTPKQPGPNIEPTFPPSDPKLLIKSKANQTSSNAIMHKAIVASMTERDEIHAQFIASKVLHDHVLQKERVQSERLKYRCLSLEKHIDGGATASNAFFVGNNVVSREQKRKVVNEMVQDSEAELLGLCKQLASEISGRTAASLEVIRLKESHAIELEMQKAERRMLEEEVEKLKGDLEEEKRKKDQIFHDMECYRKMYEELISKSK